MPKPTVYIASGLDNHAAVVAVIALFRAAGWVVGYDWTKHGRVTQLHDMATCAVTEVNAVANADLLVVLLPGGRGTHTELGVALGLEIPVIMVCPGDTPPVVSFYHHPLVDHVYTVDAALDCADERLTT